MITILQYYLRCFRVKIFVPLLIFDDLISKSINSSKYTYILGIDLNRDTILHFVTLYHPWTRKIRIGT